MYYQIRQNVTYNTGIGTTVKFIFKNRLIDVKYCNMQQINLKYTFNCILAFTIINCLHMSVK